MKHPLGIDDFIKNSLSRFLFWSLVLLRNEKRDAASQSDAASLFSNYSPLPEPGRGRGWGEPTKLMSYLVEILILIV
jgi:hypothetical protein